ncbi:hypothetical protein CDAR_494091 [Caerostris darwini]|uniref:Uncharacterized protein n=1 Tax=Caerostris darwini TaxID=1538125 RepID=A0AAV4MP88_9ARAC|nr:hypothetical protein CDAR_494091 [Caerostris darwini]
MFRFHLMDNTTKLLSEYNRDIVFFPGGLTPLIQPLDVCSNKRFKANLKQVEFADVRRGQVKNPHRLPIRKTSPRKSLPRRLFSDGKVLRLPVLSTFQGSVKSLAGIAVSFYEAIDWQIEFIRMRAWNGLPVFDSLDSRYSLGYR